MPEEAPKIQRTPAELKDRIAELNRQILATKSAKKAAMQQYNDTLKGLQEELEGTLEQLPVEEKKAKEK
jgi:hypothetical protein